MSADGPRGVGAVPAGEERPPTWSTSPVFLMPEGRRITKVLVWWGSPEYVELSVSLTSQSTAAASIGAVRVSESAKPIATSYGLSAIQVPNSCGPTIARVMSCIVAGMRVTSRKTRLKASIGASPAAASRRTPWTSADHRSFTSSHNDRSSPGFSFEAASADFSRSTSL